MTRQQKQAALLVAAAAVQVAFIFYGASRSPTVAETQVSLLVSAAIAFGAFHVVTRGFTTNEAVSRALTPGAVVLLVFEVLSVLAHAEAEARSMPMIWAATFSWVPWIAGFWGAVGAVAAWGWSRFRKRA